MNKWMYSLLVLSLTTPALADPTATPPANVTVPCGTALNPAAGTADMTAASQSSADSIAGINAGRQREGLTPLPDPISPTYATDPSEVQLLTLLNLERTVRGMPPLNTLNGTTLPDLALDLMAFNHAQVISTHPVFDNLVNPAMAGDTAGVSLVHDNSIEGELLDRLIHVPPVLAANGPLSVPGFNGEFITFWTGENGNFADTVEAAVFTWMYADSGSGYGHRSNILSCNYTNVGIGIVQGYVDATGTYQSPVEILEFIGPTTQYVSTTIDPNPTATAALTPAAITPPADPNNPAIPPLVSEPKPISSTLASFTAVPSATPGDVDITFTVNLNPVYGFDNDVRQVEIVGPANWGQADAFGNIIGELPLDMTTVLCPTTKTVAAAGQVPTYTCQMTVPGNFPLQVIGLDVFGHAVVATQAAAPVATVGLLDGLNTQ